MEVLGIRRGICCYVFAMCLFHFFHVTPADLEDESVSDQYEEKNIMLHRLDGGKVNYEIQYILMIECIANHTLNGNCIATSQSESVYLERVYLYTLS